MRSFGLLAILATLAPLSLTACNGCSEDKGLTRANRRLWGRQRVQAEIEEKAKEPIDANALDAEPTLKNRVLSMTFDEVLARLGFVEYRGITTFKLRRNKNALTIHEDTLIQHGLHGSFRMVQKDQDGKLLRETVFNNEVMYGRDGRGKMRIRGQKGSKEAAKLKDEGFQPLRVYTSYFGPRAGLRKVGPDQAGGRATVRYDFVLLEGSELITVPKMKGAKKPISLSGELHVDRESGAPVKGKLKGKLEIPPPKEGQNPGAIDFTLDFSLKPIEGKEIKPGEFEPTIKRKKVNDDPLAFLDGGTRTSTVIGGTKEEKE